MAAPKNLLEPTGAPNPVTRLLAESLRPSQPPPISRPEPSQVLGRLQAFLPQLQAANQELEHKLQQQPREALDIEHLEEGEEAPHIEMELACGLFDLQDAAAVKAAERALADGSRLQEFEHSPTGSSGYESDDSSESDDGAFVQGLRQQRAEQRQDVNMDAPGEGGEGVAGAAGGKQSRKKRKLVEEL